MSAVAVGSCKLNRRAILLDMQTRELVRPSNSDRTGPGPVTAKYPPQLIKGTLADRSDVSTIWILSSSFIGAHGHVSVHIMGCVIHTYTPLFILLRGFYSSSLQFIIYTLRSIPRWTPSLSRIDQFVCLTGRQHWAWTDLHPFHSVPFPCSQSIVGVRFKKEYQINCREREWQSESEKIPRYIRVWDNTAPREAAFD